MVVFQRVLLHALGVAAEAKGFLDEEVRLLAPLVAAIVAIFALQVAGLGMVNLLQNQAWAIYPLYGLPIAVSLMCLAYALGKPDFTSRKARRARLA